MPVSKVTELDFNKIKDNLKAYFKRSDSPFKDWDFEGSGLSYLLDILAYNTHYNAVNAHLSMNESFLDSAQLRSNVVSRAKLIGYTPRSKRGARATVNISFNRHESSTRDTLTLPRGTRFSTALRGTTYTFVTIADYFTVYDVNTNSFVFNDVEIVQGVPKTFRYLVDGSQENQRFVIDDPNIDTYTLQVRVFFHENTSDSLIFVDGSKNAAVRPDSNVYFLSENYEGKYQLEFGDGIIGRRLNNLNVVEANFLSSAGNETNGASQFRFIEAVGEVFNTELKLDEVVTIEKAYGGDDRESIESIRQVAPYSYIAQNRAVTEKDFEALIRKNLPDIEAISIWGGQNHIPPQFGKIFISAKPKSGFFLSNAQKKEILHYLDTVKIVTTKPEMLDPDYVYLGFDIQFGYDSSLTSLTKSQLEFNVRGRLEKFNEEVVRGFEKTFRYSQFLQTIDETDEAILNSYAQVYVYKQIPIFVNQQLPYTINFNIRLKGQVDQKDSIISSDTWMYNNRMIELGDEPISTSETLRNVYLFRNIRNGKKIINPSIGTLDIEKGVLKLEMIPTTFDTSIFIKAIPARNDIATIRNQLIDIDFAKTKIIGSSAGMFR